MSNGRLVPPDLDDRTWQDIVNEAKALIPKYAPEWTDHNPSDLGITLIELFAWLSEQIIYRLNRVPDKNYVKFLDLIGVRRDPPTPARADITFKIAGNAVVTIPQSTQVSTTPTGAEAGIIFETEEVLNAVNIKKCIFLDERNVYRDLTRKLLEEPFETADLSLPGGKSRMLLLGIAAPMVLPLSITFRVHSGSASVHPQWVYSTTNDPAAWPPVFQVTNPDFSFEDSDKVGIRIPAGWQQSAPEDWGASPDPLRGRVADSLYWIGIHLSNTAGSDKHILLDRVAANITSAINVITLQEEILGTSNGQAFQVFSLRNAPLYQDFQASDPLRHLIISINTGGALTVWQRVEDFAQENVAQYMCDPITGEISFGNYPTGNPDNPGYGRIPADGSQIKAVTYRYVAGGNNGNVPASTILVQRNPVAGVISIKNETEATGGSDWEEIEDTKRRGPQIIKIRDRAVTVEDYEYLAFRASTDVAKVRCLPPKKETADAWITTPLDRTPGNVNILIVPNDRVSRQPVPSQTLITEVKDYLDERRTITSILTDRWLPFYVEICVIATVYVRPGQNTTIIRQKTQQIQQKLYDFFHPVAGGPKGQGWEIGQDLYIPDVFAVLESIPELSYISELKIGRAGSPPVTGVRLEVKDYEIICASALNDTNYAITVEEEELEP